MQNPLPPVIEDFLTERNIFPKTKFTFYEITPSIYDMMTKTGEFTSVSYLRIEDEGRPGQILIENQDGDLRIIRNSFVAVF